MKTKISKRILFLIKAFSGVFIYFLMRFTYVGDEESYFDLDATSLFYLIYTAGVLFTIWELNDRLYHYFNKKYNKINVLKEGCGSPGRIRTAGQTINSRLLYR